MPREQRDKYVREIVPALCRQHSEEAYLTGLRLSGQLKSPLQRDLYFALHALNGEVAQVKDSTRSPSTGQLRLEWWRSGLRAALAGDECPRVPVLIALASINQSIREINASAGTGTAKLPELRYAAFRELFKWREVDLHWTQPPDYNSIEKYAEGVYSQLLYAQLKYVYATSSLSPELMSSAGSSVDAAAHRVELETDHVASHVGKCYGLVQLLRGTSHHAKHNITYLPADLCAKHGVSEDMIYQLASEQQGGASASADVHRRVGDVVFEVADYAHAHLKHARQLSDSPNVIKASYPLFYCTASCDVFLKQLHEVNFDVFHPSLASGALRFRMLAKLATLPWFGNKY